MRTFADYDELVAALAPLDAIKVATWWRTAIPVWRASVVRRRPGLLRPGHRDELLPGRPRAPRRGARQLSAGVPLPDDLGLESRTAGGARARGRGDLAPDRPRAFRPLTGVERDRDTLLALGRSNPLKNLPLTLSAWRALPLPRPELLLFGSEPELADAGEPGIRYVENPSDAAVNELLNQATVFLQTSSHEGFCLPILEAMATGGAVVCTDAHGNRDFCADGDNCLMPAADSASVSAAVARLLADPGLRERLGRAGIATAARYGWPERLDALDRFMAEVSRRR